MRKRETARRKIKRGCIDFDAGKQTLLDWWMSHCRLSDLSAATGIPLPTLWNLSRNINLYGYTSIRADRWECIKAVIVETERERAAEWERIKTVIKMER